MSYQNPAPGGPSTRQPGEGPIVQNSQVAMIAYVLVLASFVVPLAGIVAVILAYANRHSAPAWLATHFSWIIRTFWITVAYTLAIGVFVLVSIVNGGDAGLGVGIMLSILLSILMLIWLLVRMIRGLMLLNNREPIGNPQSWLF
ncbi:MAG: hypothetical protein LCH88_21200 [Proteobacteria bacterium]|nr:hypothetical protein [Pseudomonadota bacterium]